MAETFGKRQRAQRKKERQLNKKERKQERAAGDAPEMTERDITRDYFDGVDPNAGPDAENDAENAENEGPDRS